jgi:hypothetical protein
MAREVAGEPLVGSLEVISSARLSHQFQLLQRPFTEQQ